MSVEEVKTKPIQKKKTRQKVIERDHPLESWLRMDTSGVLPAGLVLRLPVLSKPLKKHRSRVKRSVL